MKRLWRKPGAAPLAAALRQIAALNLSRDLPAFLAQQHLTLYASTMLFDFGSNQDFADSDRSSRSRMPADWACRIAITTPRPTRSRKRSARSMWPIWRRCCNCWAIRRRSAGAEAEDRHAHRDRAGQSFAHARGAARSLQAVPQDDARPVAGADALISLERVSAGHRAPRQQVVNVTQPAFYKELETQLESRFPRRLKTYLRWHLVHARARFLSSGFRGRRISISPANICAASPRCIRAGSAACNWWITISAKRWARSLWRRPSRRRPRRARWR